MSGKYMKKSQKVINFTPLTALSALIDARQLRDMTVEQLGEALRTLPEEMSVILDSMYVLPQGTVQKSSYASVQNYERTVIRTSCLDKTAINLYRRSQFDWYARLGNVIEEFEREQTFSERYGDEVRTYTKKVPINFKDQLAQQINGVTTVAGLKNVPNVREALESQIALMQIYKECRLLGFLQMNSKVEYLLGGNYATVPCNKFDIEVVAVYEDCRVSLVNALLYNNDLINIIANNKASAILRNAVRKDGLLKYATNKNLEVIIALAAYFGLLNTDDTFEFDEDAPMTVRDFIIMFGRSVNSVAPVEGLLHDIDYASLGLKLDDIITRYDAIKIVLKYYDLNTAFLLKEAIEENTTQGATAAGLFTDIAPGSKYDTEDVAAMYHVGIINGVVNHEAKMDEQLTMGVSLCVLINLLYTIKDVVESKTDQIQASSVKAS